MKNQRLIIGISLSKNKKVAEKLNQVIYRSRPKTGLIEGCSRDCFVATLLAMTKSVISVVIARKVTA